MMSLRHVSPQMHRSQNSRLIHCCTSHHISCRFTPEGEKEGERRKSRLRRHSISASDFLAEVSRLEKYNFSKQDGNIASGAGSAPTPPFAPFFKMEKLRRLGGDIKNKNRKLERGGKNTRGIISGIMIRDCEEETLTHHFM